MTDYIYNLVLLMILSIYCILPVEIKDTARALNLPAHSPGKPQCIIKNIALQFPIETQWEKHSLVPRLHPSRNFVPTGSLVSNLTWGRQVVDR